MGLRPRSALGETMTEKRELEITMRQLRERIEYWNNVQIGSPDMKRQLLRQLTDRLHETKAKYAEFIGK